MSWDTGVLFPPGDTAATMLLKTQNEIQAPNRKSHCCKWKAAARLFQGNCQGNAQMALIFVDESLLQGSCSRMFDLSFSQNVHSSGWLPPWAAAAQEGADRTKQSSQRFQAGLEDEGNQVYQAVEEGRRSHFRLLKVGGRNTGRRKVRRKRLHSFSQDHLYWFQNK